MRRNIGPLVSEKPMEGQLRIRCTMHVCKGVAGYPTRCLPDAGLSSSRTLLEIYRGDEHLVTGDLVCVYKDPVANASAPIPEEFRQLIVEFENVRPEGAWPHAISLSDVGIVGCKSAATPCRHPSLTSAPCSSHRNSRSRASR